MGSNTGTNSATDKGTDSEGRWLTYGELAAVRRIDRHSAVKLVTRHGWRRQKDNRGVLRIFVPAEWAMSRDKGTDITDKGTDVGTDMGIDLAAYVAAYREAMEGQLAALRGQNGALQAVIDRQAAETILLRGQFAGALGEAAEARERARAAQRDADALLAASDVERDRLRVDLDTMREVVRQSQDAADTLRQAEEARKGRGLVERLRAAWRGE